MRQMYYFPYPLWDLAERCFPWIGKLVTCESCHEDYKRPGKRVWFISEFSADACEHELYASIELFRSEGEQRSMAAMAELTEAPHD